jgi:hypothetical protein
VSVFQDTTGQEWRVSFDAFLLDDIRRQAQVDLADLSAGGWLTVGSDAGAAVRVLAVACQDERKTRNLDARQFARLMRADAITAGRAALLAEGADFFPPSEWSVMLSSLTKAKEKAAAAADLTTLEPMLRAISLMPEDMRRGATQALAEAIQGVANTDSQQSEDSQSAGGLEGIQSNAATT